MRVIPVLDLLDGCVVRGVAGKREEYRPVESVLVDGHDPPTIARAIRTGFGLAELYVADLDAILHRRPNLAVLRALADESFTVMADAGIRRADDAAPLISAGVHRVVAGLETLAGPNELRKLCGHCGSGRIVFSLDLRNGDPLGDRTPWGNADAIEIARQAVDAGVTQVIVLDIAQVGVAGGVRTLALCNAIRREFPAVSVVTGGGVRDVGDLRRLAESGLDGALIASALHNGSIRSDDLRTL